VGCGSSDGSRRTTASAASPSPPPTRSTDTDSSVTNPGTPTSDRTAVALLRNESITLADVRTALLEARGAEVLADLILDRMIARRLAESGMRVADADVEEEKRLFLASLSDDANEAQRLVNDIRDRRGLGPTRFAAMMRRSAGLRKLVQTEVEVTEAAIDQAYALEYGPQYQCRLIVVSNLREAGRIVNEARAGTAFTDLVVAHSTDSSRAQGGLLPPISPADSTFPQSVRAVVKGMSPGQISDPVNIDNGFAILKCESVTPASNVSKAAVRSELEQRVRRNVEGMLMDQQARSMLRQARGSLVILDATLKRAWDAGRSR